MEENENLSDDFVLTMAGILDNMDDYQCAAILENLLKTISITRGRCNNKSISLLFHQVALTKAIKKLRGEDNG